MTRQQFINVLLPLIVQDTKDRATADRIIEMKTTSELGVLYARFVREGRIKPPTAAVTQAAANLAAQHAAQELETIRDQHAEALSRARAEREADRWAFQHQQYMDREPERTAQLENDKQTFLKAYNRLRAFRNNDANWHIVSSTLGAGFSGYDLEQALASNAIQLSKPTQAEIEEWTNQDVARRNAELKVMSIPDLKRELVKEQSANRIAESQRESNELLEEIRQSHLQGNFPPLPEHDEKGKKIDGTYIKRLCNLDLAKYKFWIKKYGGYQLTLRLQGRA